jgi:hypothetical protein
MNSRSKRGEARQLGCWLLPGPERIMARHPCSRKADSRLLDARTFWKNARRERGRGVAQQSNGVLEGLYGFVLWARCGPKSEVLGSLRTTGLEGSALGLEGIGMQMQDSCVVQVGETVTLPLCD